MQVKIVPINDVIPYQKNPRKNDRAVDVVAVSIRDYGFKQPLVLDKNNVIVVGHTRYKAAQKLNLTHVPVVIAEDLTPEQAQAYRLADNKTNQYAKWDDELLAGELQALLDQMNSNLNVVSEMTAFSALEIENLLRGKNYVKDQQEELKTRQQEVLGRIGILVLKNSYVNRGVATYVNGWIEWGIRNNVIVDVISNAGIDDVSNNQFERYLQVANWIGPDQESNSNDDNDITMRTPIIRLNDSVNLRSSLIKALSTYSYDAILTSTIDNLFTVISMGLDRYYPDIYAGVNADTNLTEVEEKHFPDIYYVTHSPVDIGKMMTNDLHIANITKSLLAGSSVKVLCQSEWMRSAIKEYAGVGMDRSLTVTPMLGQPELLDMLDADFTDRAGILFIGPYEERKGSKKYIELCHLSKLPAIVITPSQASADKFKKDFLNLDIKHEIYVGLSGINKVNAMKSAALAVIPSVSETFCYTALEAAHICRCIIPKNRDWTSTHDRWCIRVDEDQMLSAVREHYNKPIPDSTKQALIEIFHQADQEGLKLLDRGPKKTRPVNNALTKLIDKKGRVSIREFVASRPSRVIDELYYVFAVQNHSDYVITHTMQDSYIQARSYNPKEDLDLLVSDNITKLLNL